MTLMDAKTWAGQVFGDGWNTSRAGDAAVVEPATGDELGRVGIAAPGTWRRRRCGPYGHSGSGRRPFEDRAAVLRRAGQLFEEHAEEIGDWLVREAGSVPPKAELETNTAAQECYEAAALASQPQGEILQTPRKRLSLARRVPVGVVGVIAPFNVPLILAIRSVAPALALGNAVILKPDPRTAVSGGVAIARVFEEAGLPPGLLHVLPGGAESGRRWSATRWCG